MAMSRTNSILVKLVLFLFALNSLSLYLYFHPFTGNRPPLPGNQFPLTDNHSLLLSEDRRSLFDLKPWPILPSYLPWTENSS
ncbi:hypothetical protein CRG98_002073, partial [Punica granatum]